MFGNKLFHCHIKAEGVWQKSPHQGFTAEGTLHWKTFPKRIHHSQTARVNLKQSDKGKMSKLRDYYTPVNHFSQLQTSLDCLISIGMIKEALLCFLSAIGFCIGDIPKVQDVTAIINKAAMGTTYLWVWGGCLWVDRVSVLTVTVQGIGNIQLHTSLHTECTEPR